jgi:hypothetical protein
MTRIRKRFRAPSPAMVVACISLAIALSGVSYAAVVLPRNSVGTAQLKRNAVTSAKVRDNTLSGNDVNEARLGQVPSAATAGTANNAANAANAANADHLDNLDSAAFAQAGHNHDDRYFTETEADGRFVRTTDERVFAFGQIREDATIRNASSRVAGVVRPASSPAGVYCIQFSSSVAQNRLESAVVGLAGSGNAALFARNSNGQGGTCPGGQSELEIRIVNASGTLTNGRFSFIVP